MHTHVYPDKIAQRTLAELSKTAPTVEICTGGTFEDTREKMKAWKIDGFAPLNILMNPASLQHAIEYSCSLIAPNIFPFCSLHPDTENPEDAIKQMKKHGIYGVKMHPDYQDFYIDEERMLPVYALLERYELPILFHVGYDPYSPDLIHGQPKAVKVIADMFPKLKIIAAHIGGMLQSEDVLKYTVGLKNVWFDTSMSYGFVEIETARRIILEHRQVIFGSDCPWHVPVKEVDYVRSLDLGDRLEEEVFSLNTLKLLGL